MVHRSAAVHRRVYHLSGEVERLLGLTRERFEEERALSAGGREDRIVVRGPLDLRVLRPVL